MTNIRHQSVMMTSTQMEDYCQKLQSETLQSIGTMSFGCFGTLLAGHGPGSNITFKITARGLFTTAKLIADSVTFLDRRKQQYKWFVPLNWCTDWQRGVMETAARVRKLFRTLLVLSFDCFKSFY